MSDRERLLQILDKAIFPHENVDPLEAVTDYLLDNGVTFATDTNVGGNLIPYEERVKTYTNALIHYGDRHQMIVAIEELSECQKEICKILRGGENFPHLAEEIADVLITMEQMTLMFGLEDQVSKYMDIKVTRLDDDLKRGTVADRHG
jgi:hypothetical protein